MRFCILVAVSLAACSIGFKSYVWFISIGYGLAVAALGVTMLVMFAGGGMSVLQALLCLVLVAYGLRLGGYLLLRELKSASYKRKMQGQITTNSDVSMGARVAIWISAGLLYVLMVSPVLFRLEAGEKGGVAGWVGLALMVAGALFEVVADAQKQRAKSANPARFCDQGLYRLVRCPNYLGELILWTGVLVSGVGAFAGALRWVAAILGWACIVYVMFSGARRLEIRQDASYGDDPEYQRYVSTTPIILPLVPLYSVKKHTWLVG